MNSTPPGSRESTSSLPSLAEVHRTIRVPIGAGFWRKLLVFSGPGFVVAVGYMDPGNWATDIAGGSRFAYRLISILMLSCLMALDVLAILYLQHRGFRFLEIVVVTLIGIIGACYLVEIILVRPSLSGIVGGFVPRLEIVTNPQMLFIAVSILGATVMPHNLYLHSSIVQTRAIERTPEGLRTAMRFNFIDCFLALNFAFLINAAILIMAAAAFNRHGLAAVAEIQSAYQTL